MINDKAIAWNRKRVFFPAQNNNSMFLGDANEKLTGQGAGTPVFAALGVAASELTGIAMGAAGDEMYDFWPLPWDVDWDQPVWGRIWFTHDSTDADTPDWLAEMKFIEKQVAVSDAGASPDGAMTFAAKAVSTTSGALEVLDWESLDLSGKISEDDVALQIMVECNGLGSAGASEIKYLGFELAYTIAATRVAARGQQQDFVNARQTTEHDPETVDQIR